MGRKKQARQCQSDSTCTIELSAEGDLKSETAGTVLGCDGDLIDL